MKKLLRSTISSLCYPLSRLNKDGAAELREIFKTMLDDITKL